MDFEEEALLLLLLQRKMRRRKKRQFWVHPIIENKNESQFNLLYNSLRMYDDKFLNYFRMSKNSFDYLLCELTDIIKRTDTTMRKSIPADERLALTIRYLATGCSFKELHYTYKCGSTTASEIVRDVCRQIWFKLQPIHLSKPNKEKWQDIAQQFKSRANFPNCLGAVDGKHIRIIHPPNICDSNYLFTYVDIGAYGKTSDSTIWKDSSLYKKMKKNELDLPDPEIISMDGNRLPYVFIGDEAFGLNEHMLRPYSGRQISEKKRVFNYRLSRARRYVECSFGILANKWRILHRPLNVAVDFAEDIVKACVVLHNIVRKQDGYNYEDTLMTPDFIPFKNNEEYRVGRSVNLVRDKFADYFISPEGELHWQYTM